MDRPAPEQGLLIVGKPIGPTSHDVVDRVRRMTGTRRVGHTGTLDPLASGVLVLCVGRATRLSEYLSGHDKRYRAGVRLGIETATYDSGGEVLDERPVTVARQQIEAALDRFRGRIMQRPPAYSARRSEGRRAHLLARKGKPVELEPRPVEFFELELVSFEPPELVIEAHCSTGTYIRSLAHDLGEILGCGAHLSSLVRTACGLFEIERAAELEQLEQAPDWRRHLVPADAGLRDWPVLDLTEEEAQLTRSGRGVAFREGASPEAGDQRHYRARCDGCELVAVVWPDHERQQFRPRKVMG